jgi:epoxyqueuosine reductase
MVRARLPGSSDSAKHPNTWPPKGGLPSWLQNALYVLTPLGLNAVGVAEGSPYDHLLSGCRSVIVLGSGGPALWDAWLAAVRSRPERLVKVLHPIDEFVADAIRVADPEPVASRRWIRCAADEIVALDFRTLALRAGLGWASRLGLVLHRDFGPWLGLRAACFTQDVIPPTGPIEGGGACDDCSAPCRVACHGSAIDEHGWNVNRCAQFHQESDLCQVRCDARLACPVGREYRYSELEQTYHYNRNIGRAQLGLYLGLDHTGTGIGPHWEDWSDS